MATVREIKREIRASERLTESRIVTFVSELRLFLESFLFRFAADLEDDEMEVIARLGSLWQAIKNSGFDRRMLGVAEMYSEELQSALDTLSIYGIDELLAIDTTTLEALARFRVEQIAGVTQKAVGDIRPLILESVVMGTPLNPVEIATKVVGASMAHVATELRTALMGFNRTVILVQSERAGITDFLYIGPDDKKTRPFCEDLLNKRTPPVYNLSEIQNMDNGQNLDVAQYGGGYNCRHTWRPVTPDVLEAIEELRKMAELANAAASRTNGEI